MRNRGSTTQYNPKNRARCYNETMHQDQYIGVTEASERLGTTVHTVRHFCDAGYIPHVRRNRSYQRLLTPAQFELLAILVRMKQSGFKKSEIKHYAKLAREGHSTAQQRLAILTTRKRQLWQEIKARQAAIDFIERQEELASASNRTSSE